MMENFTNWFGIAKPGGLDDLVIRALKTFVSAFAVFLIKRGLDNIDATALRSAIDAGWMAGGAIVLNALALLAPGDQGQKTGTTAEVDADAPA